MSILPKVRNTVLSALVFATVTFGSAATASAASKTCDNDPSTSGCTVPGYTGSWKYLSTSNGYSGDFRILYEGDIGSAGGSAPTYSWDAATGVVYTNPVPMKYWAYLNSVYATCPTADYYIDGGYAGTLNQDLAVAGWNQFGASTNYATVHFKVEADFGGNTVADAIQASW